MDLCIKFSDTTNSVWFYATFAFQHPLSWAVEAKPGNWFVSQMKTQIPCKNTLQLSFFFPLYFDTVPEISRIRVLLELWGQKKNITVGKWSGGDGFVKRVIWGIWLCWEYSNVVIVLSLPEDTAVLWVRLVNTLTQQHRVDLAGCWRHLSGDCRLLWFVLFAFCKYKTPKVLKSL